MNLEISKKSKKFNGIWFYGLAGVGKTFATQLCVKIIAKAFVIDGDKVRALISYDLGYSALDREIQLKRVLGVAEIAIQNLQVPIISTVTMSEEIYKRWEELDISVAQIIRPIDQLRKVRDIYENSTNVVGKDIKQKEFDAFKLYNNGDKYFERVVKTFVD